MKKGLLFILGMLMMVSTAEATDGVKTSSVKDYNIRYGSKSIQFIENGVTFYVYPNGELDFKSQNKFKTQYYYRNGKRYKKLIPLRGVSIRRDHFGRIQRVGNVYIDYNRFGRVSRVGSIFIDYNHRKMTQVGGLHIKYDRFGNVRYFGHVKPRYTVHSNNFIGLTYDYSDGLFYADSFYDNYDEYGEDNDFHYYKSKGKKGSKKDSIIKRKKIKKDEPIKDRKRRS